MPELTHKEALQLAEDDWHADRDNRDDALEDLRFGAGDQWDERERTEREQAGKPCLTINRTGGFVNQVAGDIRQASPRIDVIPVDGEEDKGTARILKGLIRQIEYQSLGQAAYAHGVTSAVRCGIGHWRFETSETRDSVFEQEIKIKRILDPLSVLWDADSNEIDRSDAKHCFVMDWAHKRGFKKRFNVDREGVGIPSNLTENGSDGLYWVRDDFIRFAEYWYLKPKEVFLVMTVDGRTFDITDWSRPDVDQLRASGRVVDARKAQGFEVKRRLMDGLDWLNDEEDWAGRFIPIVPVLGDEIAFDGRIVRFGLIRFAKDPQKLYNYWRSAGAEVIGKSPKAPWLVTPEMIEGWEGYWNNANRSNLPYLPYNKQANDPGAKPERQSPPTIPTAMWQEGSLAAEDMKASTSIFDASLGARSNETSGKAILARQREGDVGTFLYSDNFRMAMQRSGQILVDLIPRIYDTDRMVRILGDDDQEEFVPINREVVSEISGERLLINDLSHGRFDVRVDIGPSHTTQRIEAREQMGEAMRGNPDLWNVIGDLFFENSDFEGSQDIAERMKKVIRPEVLEDGPQEPSPFEQIVQRLGVEEQQGENAKTEAETRKISAEADQLEIENQLTAASFINPTAL